jgi:error-prone DNA polymerase
MSYIELQVTTNFSFLRGASHPEELVEHAAALNYTEIGITDRNTFAGLVRAHAAAKKKGIRIIPGCRLDLADGPGLLAFPININGYSTLSNLLSKGNLRTEKGKCDLYKADVFECTGNIIFIAIPPSSLNSHFEFDDGRRCKIFV